MHKVGPTTLHPFFPVAASVQTSEEPTIDREKWWIVMDLKENDGVSNTLIGMGLDTNINVSTSILSMYFSNKKLSHTPLKTNECPLKR